ncbi:type IV secretion system DNA-binding domain-containing protein [Candidatus Kuenenbacteria bacterium]|nr:type IV secretion system DNA-binding domain-containing protein [Candidatus Kuenenbacteria bacterium]
MTDVGQLLSLVFFKVFLAVIILIVVVVLGLWLIKKIIRQGVSLPHAFTKVILRVGLPKEINLEDTRKEITREQIIEKISKAEELFASIGGLHASHGLQSFLFGRHDHLSLEIVALDGQINFFVAVPSYLRRYLEQQIHAQYPYAQIDEVKDYNIFRPTSFISGAYLQLGRVPMFPLKTYRKMDSDPLDAITNSLSKLGSADGAAIQFMARSAKSSWRLPGLKVVKEMQSGKTMSDALKAAGAASWLGQFGHSVWQVSKDMFVAGTSGKTKDQKEHEEQAKGYHAPHKLSALEEETAKGIEEKAAKAGLDVNLRIVVSASDKSAADRYLDDILNSFSQYNIYEYGNKFTVSRQRSADQLIHDFIYRHFDERRRLVLNTEECASLFHFPLPTCETPNINWLHSRTAPPPVGVPQTGLILGRNIYRGEETIIRIKEADRRRHVYIIGMTGVGKTVLMENMIRQDIEQGRGVCVVDPHGGLAEKALEFVPRERAEDVIYFNPADIERPVGLNMLEAETVEEMDFVTQEMVQIFYKLVTDPAMIGPMFEHNMRNAMFTLMADREHPGTMAEIPRIFTDTAFQKYKLRFVTDPMVRAFWEKEMAQTSDFHKSEMLGYLISKVGRFVENEMIRNIIGQAKSGFDFKEVMNKGKILIINLSKGQIGEVNSNLLGLIAVSKLQMAAFSRANLPESERRDFYLYIDEFQNYVTDSIATILAEARKYKLNLIMAHQYISQLVSGQDTRIRDAVFGNAGTMISFRIGVEDAETMAKQFAPVFGEYDVMNVEKYSAYIRLLVDNTASRAFNMACYPPSSGSFELAAKIKELSRLKYGRDRAIVSQEILVNSRLGEAGSEVHSPLSESSL